MIEKFNKEQCLDIYRKLRLGRRFEQKSMEEGSQGEILGSIHVGIGMEAVGVGISLALKEGDIALKTHRDHGQLIAEGVHPKFMFAELMGKINGYNKGLGGSMHLAGISGVLGVNGPMAAGAALAFKLKKLDRVAVGLYGDGAANLGPLHEAINMAAIWTLPVVFVCQNNQYARPPKQVSDEQHNPTCHHPRQSLPQPDFRWGLGLDKHQPLYLIQKPRPYSRSLYQYNC